MKSSNLFGLFVFCFPVVHSWDQPASHLEHEIVSKFRPRGGVGGEFTVFQNGADRLASKAIITGGFRLG